MKMKNKYLIFLDIDGVLTSGRVHKAKIRQNSDGEQSPLMWSHFDPIAVDFFNRINDEFPVEFVSMSTWSYHLPLYGVTTNHLFESVFCNAGFQGKWADPWKTNPENDPSLYSQDRAYHVWQYLDVYSKNTPDFLLFDDTQYRFNAVLGKKRFIHTDPDNGLLMKHMDKAWSIMGEWTRLKKVPESLDKDSFIL